MGWYFTYNQPLPRGFVAGVVVDADESWVMLRGPLDDVAEIGSFAAKLPDESAARLRGIVNASKYTAIAPGPSVVPETPVVTMGEGMDKDMPTIRGFALPTLPPELKPVMDEMSKLIGQVRQVPHHIARAQGRWSAPTFKPDGALTLRVRLTNPGTVPAELYDPGGPLGKTHAVTMLAVGRNLPPSHFVEERDLQTVVVDPSEISMFDAQGNPVPAADTIVLPPGGSVELELSKTVFLSPGQYRGTVTFNFVEGNIDPGQSVHGILLVQVGPTAVSP